MTEIEHLRNRLKNWQSEDVVDLLANCDLAITKLQLALRAAARNDKSNYNHHETRPFDNTKPNPGTIWLTPREIARRALSEPNLATGDDHGN